MGAYSNPDTYVDTQTAQSYQRLQDTISGTFTKVAESYSARQKEIRTQLEENAKQLKANDMKSQEYAFSLYKDLAKAGASDPTVNWGKTYEPLIKRAVEIRSGMLNNTLEDKQAAMKELGEIEASVDNVVGSIATLSAVGTTVLGAKAKGVKTQGGAASSNSPSIDAALGVLTQGLPGKKEFYFKDNDPKRIMLKVSDEKGNVLQEFDAEQIKKLSKGEGVYRVIPNQIAEFDKLKSTNSTIFETTPVKPGEKGDPMPTGQVNPDYLVRDASGKIVVEKNEYIDTGGFKQFTFNQKVDIEKIKRDENLDVTIRAQAKGLLDSNQSGAIDFYNDIMSDPKGRWKGTGFSFEPNKPLDEEGKKKFIEDYKEYYINTQIMPTQQVLKLDSDIMSVIEKPAKESTKTGGKGKTGQLTENQRLKLQEKQEIEQEESAKLTNVRSTDPVKSVDGKERVVWRGGKNGMWYVQQKKNGEWIDDLDQQPTRSKTKAASLIKIKKPRP
jgi:hypothetical protein